MDGLMDEWMDGLMNGWMNGWMDVIVAIHIHVPKHVHVHGLLVVVIIQCIRMYTCTFTRTPAEYMNARITNNGKKRSTNCRKRSSRNFGYGNCYKRETDRETKRYTCEQTDRQIDR